LVGDEIVVGHDEGDDHVLVVHVKNDQND
jgi:hypothetical protein